MSLDVKTAYFDWLYSLIFRIRDPDSEISFVILCDHLHQIPFSDSFPNDDNRAAYGMKLRDDFAAALDIGPEAYAELCSLGPKASLFEMMTGLAIQANFQLTVGLEIWLREFIGNLGLLQFSDARYTPKDSYRINRVLNKFNARRYAPNGKGGLFPLKVPNYDQRQVELWYQLAAYITENHTY